MTYETALLSEGGLEAFLHAFENGTLPAKSWTHAAHLIMAACYVLEGGDVLGRARRNIRAFNEASGGANTEDSGYHETLTRFWLGVVTDYLAALPASTERLDKVRCVVREFGNRRDLFREFYTFDVVKSRAARAGWTPPDRSPDSATALRNGSGIERSQSVI